MGFARRSCAVLLGTSLVVAAAAVTPITQANIHEAVGLHCSDEAAATAQYGPIAEWDTKEITSFRGLFSPYYDSTGNYNFNGGEVDDSYPRPQMRTCNPDLSKCESLSLYL